MKLIDHEIEIQMPPQRASELRQRINIIQFEINKLNNEAEKILKELTSGVMKKTIKVCEEETEIGTIGWFDGQVIYRKPNALPNTELSSKPAEDKIQPSSNLQGSFIDPPEEEMVECQEGPVFALDVENEEESLV